MLRRCWAQRKDALRLQDQRRENDPDWYRRRDLLGMMLYTNAFAGTLKGVEEKLPYIQECGVNYLHLMPLLEKMCIRDSISHAQCCSLRAAMDWALRMDFYSFHSSAGGRSRPPRIVFCFRETISPLRWPG